MSREQRLVSAQVEVNRAVFLMNVRGNRDHYPDVQAEDDDIANHIKEAKDQLSMALDGYQKQQRLKL